MIRGVKEGRQGIKYLYVGMRKESLASDGMQDSLFRLSY